jgi:hypothetical protein
MDDWIVVVPSYNRVDGFRNMTLKTLQYHNVCPAKIYLFVADEEQKILYQADKDIREGVGQIVVGRRGLVSVRNFIFEYFPVGQKLVSFDDDVRWFVRKDMFGMRKLYPDELLPFILMGFQHCEKVGARLWGDSPVPNGFYMKNTISYDLKFVIGSFWGAINPGSAVHIDIGGGEKEDYQRAIQFWEADRRIVRLNFLSHKTTTYTEPGGLQSDGIEARLLREKDVVQKLLDKWPQYLRINKRRKNPFPELLFIKQH